MTFIAHLNQFSAGKAGGMAVGFCIGEVKGAAPGSFVDENEELAVGFCVGVVKGLALGFSVGICVGDSLRLMV